jgi:glucosyl-dolichyl phosphate glucuronosyltransferase
MPASTVAQAPTISVVIATYNRAGLLDDCLSHLARQRFVHGDEVVVANNGSTDSTPEVLARHAPVFPVPLRIVDEARPGKSHALSAALASVTADIVAFTDDDVNVSSSWLAVLRQAFGDEQLALAGGPVAPRWEAKAPRWLEGGTSQHSRFNAPLALLNYGPARCPLGPRTFLGANMAVRREVLQGVGGFAPHLGKLRGTLLSGEDHDLCQRVQEAGHSALYIPEAIVHHWVPRARMRLGYFLSWFYWSGITNARLDAGLASAERRWLGVPPYLARRGVTSLLASVSAAASGRFSRAVDRALDVAFAIGYASGRWKPAQVELEASEAR